ncbi:MAG: hypothetical protein NTU44_00620 [Bacteroidetes bacterium]|nr:hypothetical protein [Bacteroidota bacterium]
MLQKTLLHSLLLFFLFSCGLFSQTRSIWLNGSPQLMNISYNPSQNAAAKVEGSPFLTDQFQPGQLVFKENNEVVKDLAFRLDLATGFMQFIFRGDTFVISNPNKIAEITYGSRRFYYLIGFIGKDSPSPGFFELLTDGKVQLMMLRRKAPFKDEYVKSYMGGGGSGRYYYSYQEDLYLRKGDDVPRKLVKRKRVLLKMLPDKQPEIKEFMKSNRLSARKIADIKKIIDFYNSL